MALLCPAAPMLTDTTHSGVLLGALGDQRTKGLFCDVTIVVEDIKFRAHRNVLAASSGYFRNALASPDVWTSGQVLELLDLRSEVFARILNFIYSSKVALTSVEDVRALVAAGKRLGIPFLERLSVSEPRPVQIIPQKQILNVNPVSNPAPLAPGFPRARRKRSDNKRGPRITNAFSITDVTTGSDLFTPAALREDGQQPVSASCPAPDPIPSASECLHTLADHSYAVSLEEGGGAGTNTPAPPNTSSHKQTPTSTDSLVKTSTIQQASQTCSPLKKRYRLWTKLDENKLSPPTQTPGDVLTGPALKSPSPDSSSPNPNTQLTPASDCLNTVKSLPALSGAPLVPQAGNPKEEFQHCGPSSAVTPMFKFRTRLPGLVLFCSFCHKKFMHWKRLRNHERVCTKRLLQNYRKEEEEATLSGPGLGTPPSDLSSPPAVDLPGLGWETGTGAGLGVVGQVGRGLRRMYPCSVCKRVYATFSSLRRHENVHSWRRTYPCHYCNKVFALAEYRTKHEVWHTGERRYQCIFCLETFMTYYILKNHQKSYHGIDPRLSVHRKSANGGFKGSVYPIKLYRLLPKKFRKRYYRTYGRASFEASEFGSQALPEPRERCSSPLATLGEGTDGLSIFSEPPTFMATPTIVAPIQPSRAEAEACLRHGAIAPPPPPLHRQGNSFDGHGDTLPELQMQTTKTSSPVIPDKELDDSHLQPDSTSGSRHDPEDSSSNTVQPPVSGDRIATGGKIATYIAKPACAGPSSNSQVPPLCQITVRIGNEAIVRRSIAGSNLFPVKKRHHLGGTQVNGDESGRSKCVDQAAGKPGLRQRSTSLGEAELCEDGNHYDDMDEPWRPYHSSKRRAKRLRSRERRGGRRARLKRSIDRQFSLPGKPFTSDQILPSDAWIGLQGTSLTCDNCQSTFSSSSAIQAHMANCHPKDQQHACLSCGKQRPLDEAPQDGREFTLCNSCAKDATPPDISTGSPTPDRRYRCSFCPQRFFYLATRRSHERKHLEKHGKGPDGHSVPKLPSLGVSQKRKSIKAEEEEVEVQQVEVGESKPVARGDLKLSTWEEPKLGSPINLKLEDQMETNCSDCDQTSTKKPDAVGFGRLQDKA